MLVVNNENYCVNTGQVMIIITIIIIIIIIRRRRRRITIIIIMIMILSFDIAPFPYNMLKGALHPLSKDRC